MSEVFCYLLGAGASCNALPVAANFADCMRGFVRDYSSFRTKLEQQRAAKPTTITEVLKYEDHFLESLEWLIMESQQHTSVDTFAKKLHLKNDIKAFNKLKITLSTTEENLFAGLEARVRGSKNSNRSTDKHYSRNSISR